MDILFRCCAGLDVHKKTVVACRLTRDAAGQTRHIVGNYRPRSTVLLLSRLIGEHFADTPYGKPFLASE